VLYAEHHRLVRSREFDVVTARPTLSRSRKLWTVARTWWHWRRTGDPVTVFRRVSAIPADEPTSEESVGKGRARYLPSPAAWILRR
jgi:phytoene synthase (EC 2.5.1.32)